jgi:2-polyprenyl-3-methyl-5-hydroxy-6-metoxy-1,4-benzoquinol methylase
MFYKGAKMNDECIICKNTKSKLIYSFEEIPEFKRIQPKKNIVKCKSCSLVYCSPRNTQETMLEVYENNYWHEFQVSVKESPITERIDEFLEISRERISYIVNFKKKCTLLDVGCSMGFLVKAAQDSGFISTGIDLNKKDIDFGIDLFDINLKKQFLGQHQKSYDVITSYNVIEHVSDPKSLLEQMASRLNNGGIIVVGTHDINCNNHKKEKVNWKHIVPNEHMYYFSKKTLSNLAELVGLKEFYTYKPIDNGFVSFFKKELK